MPAVYDECVRLAIRKGCAGQKVGYTRIYGENTVSGGGFRLLAVVDELHIEFCPVETRDYAYLLKGFGIHVLR